VLDDPRRCRALLSDLCGAYRGEINLLTMALQEGVAADLRSATGAIPYPLLFAWLTRRLLDTYFLTEEAARWAVEACAEALACALRPIRRRAPLSPPCN
jgi:hypothetical protein